MTSADDARRVYGVAYVVTEDSVAQFGPDGVWAIARIVDALERHGHFDAAGLRMLARPLVGRFDEVARYIGAEVVRVWRRTLWRFPTDPDWSRCPPFACVGCGQETVSRYKGIAVHPDCLDGKENPVTDVQQEPVTAEPAPDEYIVTADVTGFPLPDGTVRQLHKGERCSPPAKHRERLLRLGAIRPVTSDDPPPPPPPHVQAAERRQRLLRGVGPRDIRYERNGQPYRPEDPLERQRRAEAARQRAREYLADAANCHGPAWADPVMRDKWGHRSPAWHARQAMGQLPREEDDVA